TVFQGIGMSADDWRQQRELELRAAKQRAYADRVPPWSDDDPDSCAPTKPRSTIVELHRERPKSIEGLRDRTDRFIKRLGGTERDGIMLLARLVRFMTSCSERRRKEYEGQSWKEFIRIEKFSPSMQFHIQSAAQALLAFSAGEADARTYGNVTVQMLLDEREDGTRVDRTLNGPTSDAWLEPWREYLERQGVRFFCDEIVRLEIDPATQELVPILKSDDAQDKAKEKGKERPSNVRGLLTHRDPDPSLRPDFYVLAL